MEPVVKTVYGKVRGLVSDGVPRLGGSPTQLRRSARTG